MKLSIITASYNCKVTISDCINSLYNQCFTEYEHIIFDGQSSDGTLDVLNTILNSNSILISENDHGVYDALNKGLSVASGDVIGFLHSDDVYYDNNILSKVANAFSDPAVQAVYGDLVYADKYDVT